MFALAAVLAAVTTAYADWTYFTYVGNSVSVSFSAVDNTTQTWKFRNDGYNTISYMKFSYSYIDANTGRYETDTDILPGSLGPGEVFGGWAAFTANSRVAPTIRIVEIERR
jgi:hypothetical protein